MGLAEDLPRDAGDAWRCVLCLLRLLHLLRLLRLLRLLCLLRGTLGLERACGSIRESSTRPWPVARGPGPWPWPVAVAMAPVVMGRWT